MKKLLTAIVFSAMTLTGMGGGAAEAAPAPAAKPVVTIKAKTDTSAVKPKDDNTVIEAKKAAEASLAAKQVQPQVALPDTLYPRTKGDDYFKDAKLKNNITYAPLSNLTKEDIFYSGVVNVKKKDITAVAFVTGAQYEGDLADEQYSKFFVKGNLSQDAIRQLYTYNVALLRLEYGLNDVFLKTASAVKLEGEEIPYGILSVRQLPHPAPHQSLCCSRRRQIQKPPHHRPRQRNRHLRPGRPRYHPVQTKRRKEIKIAIKKAARKGLLFYWGKDADAAHAAPLKGQGTPLTLLREEKVAAEPTDKM